MNYTVNQLKVFLKVAETGSVTRASEELFLTQPAVSIQLKNFQDQFDVPLTEIIGKKLYVTDFGREIAQIAERALNELNTLKYKTREFNGLLAGRLKISSASTGKYVIPYFLTDYLDLHPGIDLVLDVTNKTKVMQSLKKNEIDFAIVSVIPDEFKVKEEILIENKLYLIGSTEHKNNSNTLIYREKGSATRQAMEAYFKGKKGLSSKRIELTSNEAVKQAVIAGLGDSILPLIGIKNQLLDGSLRIIPKKNLPLRTEWRLIWLEDKKLSPVAQSFLSHIRENKEELIHKHFNWYDQFKA
ncbi:LysR family transcriptional regulator [bacterium]|nr:LysR family transcriptional regulator [bacterium]